MRYRSSMLMSRLRLRFALSLGVVLLVLNAAATTVPVSRPTRAGHSRSRSSRPPTRPGTWHRSTWSTSAATSSSPPTRPKRSVHLTYRVVGIVRDRRRHLAARTDRGSRPQRDRAGDARQGHRRAVSGRRAGGTAAEPEACRAARRRSHSLLASPPRPRRGAGPHPFPWPVVAIHLSLLPDRQSALLGTDRPAAGLGSGYRAVHRGREPGGAVLFRPFAAAGRAGAGDRRAHLQRPWHSRHQHLPPANRQLDPVHAHAPRPVVSRPTRRSPTARS